MLDEEIRSASSLLLETAIDMGAQRIFVDGIGLSAVNHWMGSSSRQRNGSVSYRELLQQVIESFNRESLTAFLSHEVGALSHSAESLEAATFLADTVIELKSSRVHRHTHRTIEIIKSRGQSYDEGEHTLRIAGNTGLQVFRRVQAPIRRDLEQPTSIAKRSLIGVEALDTLIGGGIYDGSATMIIGISGVGKTVLGTQILREGAANGKRGLLISLDEHPAQIVRNSETLGLGLRPYIDSRDIVIHFESPQELDVDQHYAEVTALIEKHQVKRMVVDGMTSYSSALSDQSAYRDFVHALVAYSKQQLLTTFFNYESPEFLGMSSYMPDFPVSSIVDNIILLNLVELNNSLRRCVTVVKARGSNHRFESREYTIGMGGISLVATEGEFPATSAITRYSSLLSRAPTRRLRSSARKPPLMKSESQ